jgi:butyrate response factor 1
MKHFKTELCEGWLNGKCKFGVKCVFAHGKDELKPKKRPKNYKTQLCERFVTGGYCPYGRRCDFIHREDKFWVEVEKHKVDSREERERDPRLACFRKICPIN